nr:receptor-like protein EIX2 [Quercus suber]
MEGSLGFLFLTFLIIPLPHFFIFCTGHSHSPSQLRCIDTERRALLKFKKDLIDPSNRLSSWTVDGDCCHWVGVVCHNLTAHVHQLNLSTIYPSDSATEEQYEAYWRSVFGGQIPSSMSSLTFLNHLNLSNNNLIGKIPLSTQLQSFEASSFIGNKLCGPPLTDNCTINGVKPNNENIGNKGTLGLEADWFYVSMALGFAVGFLGVCCTLLLNKQRRIIYFRLLDHMGNRLRGVVLL